MGHNIMEGKRVFAVGDMWHGLGKVLDKPATAEQAIQEAQLDYELEKQQKQIASGKIIPGSYAIVNKENGLPLPGVDVGPLYGIIQNREAFSFFDVLVGEGKAIYTSAGALGHGERIWLQAKLPKDIILKNKIGGDNDIIEKYLLLTNTHDGKSTLKVYFTPVRVVCQNTLNMSLSDAKKGVSIRHMGNIQNKIEEARNLLGLSLNYYNEFERIVKKMETFKVQEEQLETYFETVLGINDKKEKEVTANEKNKFDTLVKLYHDGTGNKGETIWDAYNAVTEYADHYKTVRNVKEDPTKKLNDIWFGNSADLKELAYNEAVALLK